MNKKILFTIIVTISLKHFDTNTMELSTPPHSQENVSQHSRQLLAKKIATKFKQALVDPNPLHIISLGIQKEKIFSHHDGTYDIVPDIGYKYAMWDETPTSKQLEEIKVTEAETNHAVKYVKLLHGTREGKPDFAMCCTRKQWATNNIRDIAFVFADNKIQHCECKSELKITHYALSYDHQWAIWALQDINKTTTIELFNLDSGKVTHTFTLPYPISTLCAAHKSILFAVCTENGCIGLVTPNPNGPFFRTRITDTHTNAQLSPDDNYLMTYEKNIVRLCCLNKSIPECIAIKTTYPVRKTIFTPDGKRIIIATAGGKFFFCDGCTGKALEQYYSVTWRPKHLSASDNQAPLILCSIKHNLLFSLNPACHNNAGAYNFVIRKLTNGRFLTGYNFYPDNPQAMGLTEDERSIVFTHKDNSVSLLHLYQDQDLPDIAFIEHKANQQQLIEMFQFCCQYKTQQLVTAIRNYIRNAKKS